MRIHFIVCKLLIHIILPIQFILLLILFCEFISYYFTILIIYHLPIDHSGTHPFHHSYGYPAHLVEVNGKPLIQLVLENLNLDASFFFIVNQQDFDRYHLEEFLYAITNQKSTVIPFDPNVYQNVNHRLQLAKSMIPSDEPV